MSSLEVKKRHLAGYTYTPLEQSQKEVALQAMAMSHPHINVLWREWVYDYIHKEVGSDEFSKRVDSGFYEKKNNPPIE